MSDAVQPPPAPSVEITPENVEKILAENAALEGIKIKPPAWPNVRGKPEFLADVMFAGQAPGTSLIADFDFDEVCRNLDGEGSDGETIESAAQRDTGDMASILHRYLIWLKDVLASDQRGVKSIGCRALASIWVINPSLLNNLPARDAAKMFGLDKQVFSRYASEFSRTFKMQNAFQRHDGKNQAQPKMNLSELSYENQN